MCCAHFLGPKEQTEWLTQMGLQPPPPPPPVPERPARAAPAPQLETNDAFWVGKDPWDPDTYAVRVPRVPQRRCSDKKNILLFV